MQNILRLLKKSKNKKVSILIHDDADADALGAGYVLSRITGGQVIVPRDISEHGKELMEQIGFDVQAGPADLREDLVIIADTADMQQLPGIKLDQYAVIDHHSGNKLLEKARAYYHKRVDSTCQMVFELLRELEHPLDQKMALSLAAGILGDTIYLEKAANPTIILLGEILEQGGINFKKALEVLRVSRKLSREIKLRAAIEAELFWLRGKLLVLTRTQPDYVYYVAMMLIELGADLAMVLSQSGEDISIRLVQSPQLEEEIDLLAIMKKGIGDSRVENLWGDENFVGFKGMGDDYRILKDVIGQLCQGSRR